MQWEPEPVTITANEALAAGVPSGRDPTATEEAMSFLKDLLAEGPLSVNDVKSETEAAGLSWATVTRAKTTLRIKPVKAGMGAGWFWALPKALNPEEDVHLKDVSTFGTGEHLREPMAAASVPQHRRDASVQKEPGEEGCGGLAPSDQVESTGSPLRQRLSQSLKAVIAKARRA